MGTLMKNCCEKERDTEVKKNEKTESLKGKIPQILQNTKEYCF